MVTANIPPDWYEDPFVDGQQRYWDGRQWTQGTRSVPLRHRPWTDWALLALVVVGAVGILSVTDQPSGILGFGLVLVVGAAVAVVVRQHSQGKDA